MLLMYSLKNLKWETMLKRMEYKSNLFSTFIIIKWQCCYENNNFCDWHSLNKNDKKQLLVKNGKVQWWGIIEVFPCKNTKKLLNAWQSSTKCALSPEDQGTHTFWNFIKEAFIGTGHLKRIFYGVTWHAQVHLWI